MELMLKNEAYIFIGTFLAGFILGFFCDLLGVSKTNKNGSIVFIGMRDVLFCIAMSFVSFIIIYILNNGIIRWYEIMAILCGFILYVLTLKKYVVRLLDTVKKGLYKILTVIAKPVLKIIKLFKMPYIKLKNALKRLKKLFKTVKYKQNLKIKQIKYIFKKI